MTERSILYSIKKIEAAKSCNHSLETLLKLYHLNVNILKFLSIQMNAVDFKEEMKPKHIVDALIALIDVQMHLKSYITKRNLKALKPWLSKMDAFFKTLKTKEPSNTHQLIVESENILAILKISASKLIVSEKN